MISSIYHFITAGLQICLWLGLLAVWIRVGVFWFSDVPARLWQVPFVFLGFMVNFVLVSLFMTFLFIILFQK